MHRTVILLLGMALLFCNLTCPDECEFFPSGGELTVQLENPAEGYVLGETIWLSADFPTLQSVDGREYTISDNGGLVVTQLFRLAADSVTLLPARTAFSVQTTEGEFIDAVDGGDPAALYLRYTCSGGRCAFRHGVVPDSTGLYILQITGSAIDEVSSPFQLCYPPALTNTTLEGGGNLAENGLTGPFNYARTREAFFWFDLGAEQNSFLIRVQ